MSAFDAWLEKEMPFVAHGAKVSSTLKDMRDGMELAWDGAIDAAARVADDCSGTRILDLHSDDTKSGNTRGVHK